MKKDTFLRREFLAPFALLLTMAGAARGQTQYPLVNGTGALQAGFNLEGFFIYGQPYSAIGAGDLYAAQVYTGYGPQSVGAYYPPQLEYVVDFGAATGNTLEHAYYSFGNATGVKYSIDGGAWTTAPADNANNASYHIISSTLGAGKHLVRFAQLAGGDGTKGCRLTKGGAGTELIASSTWTQVPLRDFTGNTTFIGFKGQAAGAAAYGALKKTTLGSSVPGYTDGTGAGSSGYGSGIYSVRVSNCSCLEIFGTADYYQGFSAQVYDVTTNTNFQPSLISAGGGMGHAEGYADWLPLVDSLDRTHTYKIQIGLTGSPVGPIHAALRGMNGSYTTGDIPAGTATLPVMTVAGASPYANGDWVRIGHYPIEEARQITAGGGTGTLTLSSATTYAHQANTAVVDYRESRPAAITAAPISYAKTFVVVGDSTSMGTGWNSPGVQGRGFAGDLSAVGNLNYDTNVSWAHWLEQWNGWKCINLAYQGNFSADMVARVCAAGNGGAGDYVNFGNAATGTVSSWDFTILWVGVNDARIEAAYSPTTVLRPNVVKLANDALAANPGKPVYILHLVTPLGGQLPVGGIGPYNAALDQVPALTTSPALVTVLDIGSNMDHTAGGLDVQGDGLHYTPMGYAHIAALLSSKIGGRVISGPETVVIRRFAP